jgi:hypothetical protein
MKMFSKEGVEMMDVKSIYLEGENLVLKGKMMGTMATVIHLKPEEVWRAFALMSWKTVFYMPIMLWKGFWRARQSQPPA